VSATLAIGEITVPFCDLHLQHRALGPDLHRAIERVIETSAFILGPEVAAFEDEFARYLGVAHAIGTSSGSTALLIALKALGVEPGDEVIVPAMTFYATGEAVAFLGARPVFVDIDPVTLTLDVNAIRERITPRTKVILPVHLYGHPAALDEIRNIALEYGLRVLGDAAHAHGSSYHGRKVGAIEDCAAFSFYPSKNLGCIGEGGMVTTNDADLALRCRMFRDHGSVKKFEHRHIALNGRMDGLNAAVLSVKLPHLDRWNEQRRAIARSYNAALSGLGVETPREAHGATHVFHVYQLQLDDRDRVAAFLTARRIGVTKHYPVPMHLHEGFAFLGHRTGEFPVAEKLARRTLSIPCYPGMTEEQQDYVIDNLREAV
jgi:dTDP-4-amino-4,6-dideoxygalactose transaminase